MTVIKPVKLFGITYNMCKIVKKDKITIFFTKRK